jgi:four helix bundle protein
MSREVKKYEVYKKAHQLVLRIYAVTKKFPADEKYGLISQMRRCAYSIPMNLIEGGARNSEAEFRQFVNIARGSCAEIQYQLTLVRDLQYLAEGEYEVLDKSYEEIGKMLTGLMQKLNDKG